MVIAHLKCRFYKDDIQRQLVGTNWLNADATHTVAATTSTNAREATQLMLSTALPAMTALQISIRSLTALQNGLAEGISVTAQQEIEMTHRRMLALARGRVSAAHAESNSVK